MNNIKIYLFLALLVSSSCHSQDQKFVDLEKISLKFNVSSFFENKLKKTEEILATKVEGLDKKKALTLLDNPFFAKDTLGFYPSEGRFPTALYLEATSDWMSRNKKPTELFGYRYKTVAYDPEKDTLAILNTVAFPTMNMAEDKKGNLMYLDVSKTAKNQSDFTKIKDYLEKNCNKVKVDDPEENMSYWENEHFFYKLTGKENKEEEILSYDNLGNKKTRSISVTDINLVMYTKTYIEKMKEQKIYSSGNVFWMN